MKSTNARTSLDMEKLEKSEKSHLRMVLGSAARLKLKYGKTKDIEKNSGETEVHFNGKAPFLNLGLINKPNYARKIRMYETHFPGFCYLRNGEYRKKTTNSNISSIPDPVQCSSKIKSILFTDNELDNFKTMCLHLLGTHVQNKHHIQRKDGRLCSYVKTQTSGNALNTLHPMSQRVGFSNEEPSKYDKMLPRYILDVKLLKHGSSATSFKTSDVDSGSDDESKKKRKLIVPIFVNNEIRMIVNSVMEALETVESPKLKDLIELASSPEELRNMLTTEEAQEYMAELAKNPLVVKPTSYDFVMAHLLFDKIPEKGTLETVAQVLEVYDDTELKNSLQQIRRGILNRHMELTVGNAPPRKRNSLQEPPPLENSKVSNTQGNSSQKSSISQSVANIKQDEQEDMKLTDKRAKDLNNLIPLQKKNQTDSNKKSKSNIRTDARSTSAFPANVTDGPKDVDESSDEEGRRLSRSSTDSNKSHMHNLTNSQRILLGLKVASLKSKPINMHQFEGKKKVDIAALINPILRNPATDLESKQSSSDNQIQKNFGLVRLKPERTVKKSMSNSISKMSTTDLENLTRALLAQLRLEIAETENKKRLNQFMSNI